MKRHSEVADQRALRRQINSRIKQAAVIALLAITVVVGRYWYLQVAAYDEFMARSDDNRIRSQALAPTRGIIYDRNGVVVADNRPAYRLEIVRERLNQPLEEVLASLAERIELTDSAIEAFQQRSRQKQAFQPVVLRFNLTEQEIARIAVDLHRLDGVEITPYLTRYYPFTTLLAHAVGYVGRISETELQRVDQQNYRATDYIGKTGLERFYEGELHGQSGFARVETNAAGRVVKVLHEEPPVSGNNIHLTLDVRLQRIAALALGDYSGAVVAMLPETGEVLALVSNPGYNPNIFINGISTADYQALLNDSDRPLFNRAVQGGYEPGSTMKPFIAMLALDAGVADDETLYYSTGEFRLDGKGRAYRDARRGGHGWVNLQQALEQSVNTTFYQIAVELGIDRMSTGLSHFGFGQPTGLDLIGEASGILPSREWKRRHYNQIWFPGETVISGIGQGYHVVTPLQLAQATSLLATGGKASKPRLAVIKEPVGIDVQQYATADWSLVQAGMHDAVNGARGTARTLASPDYYFAGKTGTAQVVSRKQGEEIDKETLRADQQNHALFIAYAPSVSPDQQLVSTVAANSGDSAVTDMFEQSSPLPLIAVAVIVEHGGSGPRTAAPVARAVLDAWAQINRPNDLIADLGEPGQ